MLQIAVCDDSPEELALIRQLLDSYQAIRQMPDLAPQFFSSPKELLASKDSCTSFQIYLLDVLLPETNGIDLGRQIREQNLDCSIIYLTGSKDYALESYGVFALQYLLKPVGQDAFFAAMDAAVRHIEHFLATSIPVKTQQGLVSLLLHRILYVEYANHVLHFHMIDGEQHDSSHIRISFEEAAAPLLADPRFLHPHKSYVINMNYVQRISSLGLVMDGDAIIPIPRKNSSFVKKQYMQFLSEKGHPLPTKAGK